MASINSQRAPSSAVTFLMGIACLAVFAAIIVAWTKSNAPKTDLVEAERGAARLQKRLDLEKEWAGKLQTVAWIDKEKGAIQVPIDEAIKSVAVELKEKKVAKSAVKIPAVQPPPVADPKSTEPPPPLLPSAPQGADLIEFPQPASTEAPAAVPATPAPVPTPVAPSAIPAPVIPAPAIPPAPVAASATPSRPPLINWTESK